jgi:hypothetical protein
MKIPLDELESRAPLQNESNRSEKYAAVTGITKKTNDPPSLACVTAVTALPLAWGYKRVQLRDVMY